MNKLTDLSRTITALATALGTGSIAVLRVSGRASIPIVSRVFKGTDLNQAAANTIHFGRIIDKNRQIDQVLVSVFKAPHSYTGEDTVEISCHANAFLIDDIIDVLVQNGAHHAQPGEFSFRAFLNGKMDLSQAEAVAALIQSKSRLGVYNSLQQLEGALTQKIYASREHIIQLTAQLEIDLDFSEENIPIADPNQISAALLALHKELQGLSNSFNMARIFESGISLAIIGEPNVGKSTLMNALLGENRAITSEIPGTTRDMIRENLLIDHIFTTVTDTAGLRSAGDAVEHEGMRRTRETAGKADIILYVLDINQDIGTESAHILDQAISAYADRVIIVANKSDRGVHQNSIDRLKKKNLPLVVISALEQQGMDYLKKQIRELLQHRLHTVGEEVVITSKRQRDALAVAADHINNACQSINAGTGYEFITVDLRNALNALGEITGETVTDDILNHIFSNFCIGK